MIFLTSFRIFWNGLKSDQTNDWLASLWSESRGDLMLVLIKVCGSSSDELSL